MGVLNRGVRKSEERNIPTEVENQLIVAAQRGDAAALQRLCEQYEPLVNTVARRFQGPWLADARQEAWLALVKAIHLYRPTFGVRFAGFALATVRGDVKTAWRREVRHEDRRASSSFIPAGETGAREGDSMDAWMDPKGNRDYEAAEWEMVLAKANLSPRETLSIRSAMLGEPCAELARKEGVSVESVKTWRKRAFRKVRSELASR